jgi:hypothetical protein
MVSLDGLPGFIDWQAASGVDEHILLQKRGRMI